MNGQIVNYKQVILKKLLKLWLERHQDQIKKKLSVRYTVEMERTITVLSYNTQFADNY